MYYANSSFLTPRWRFKKVAMSSLDKTLPAIYPFPPHRGVAHVVEHLAFNATERFDNHAIVQFLETIGAAFGPCQNAYTSSDETVYELLVPLDKDGLKQARALRPKAHS